MGQATRERFGKQKHRKMSCTSNTQRRKPPPHPPHPETTWGPGIFFFLKRGLRKDRFLGNPRRSPKSNAHERIKPTARSIALTEKNSWESFPEAFKARRALGALGCQFGSFFCLFVLFVLFCFFGFCLYFVIVFVGFSYSSMSLSCCLGLTSCTCQELMCCLCFLFLFLVDTRYNLKKS